MNVLQKVEGAVLDKMGVTGLKIREKSPEILLGISIVSMVGAVVTSVIAARKQDDIWDNHLTRVEEAKLKEFEVEVTKKDENGNEYKTTETVVRTDKEIKTAVCKEYMKTGVQEAKVWGPTALLMGVNALSTIKMHGTMGDRISGLSSELMATKAAYDFYQKNNIALNGEENHNMCKYGYKDVSVQDEDGFTETKRVMKTPKDWKEEENPCIESFFLINKDNSGLSGFANTDILMLQAAENEIKRKINTRGWAVWNDYFDLVKMPRTQSGMVMGWIKGGKEVKTGWNSSANNRCLAGYNNEDWTIELNCDGDISHLLKLRDKAEIELKERARKLAEDELKRISEEN